MSYIQFRALQATLILDAGEYHKERIHMTVVAKLSHIETLVLEDGTSMEGKTWNLNVFRKMKGQETEHLGFIAYFTPVEDEYMRHTQPEAFFVEIGVDDREFESLLTSVRTVKAAPGIRVHVSGLDYGPSPDGDDVIWRNKTSPKLPVISAGFEWPLGKFETDDEQSDDYGSLGNPPLADQSKIPLTVDSVRQAAGTINKSLRLVAWMIAGLTAAVIFF